ncbi:MAG: class I SAM-dependent methyltransferase [Bacteroidota bacterium]
MNTKPNVIISNNFNFVAPFYESLKKIVFGKQLKIAEQYFAGLIKSGDRVLIVGGGNGDILNHIKSGCFIDYIELSKAMITNAAKQQYNGEIRMINEDFLSAKLEKKYDWIITNFFLDVFNQAHLIKACEKLYLLLKDDGQFIVTDFYPTNRIGGKILLKLMHVFFKLVSGLESNSLKNIPDFLLKTGFEASQEKFWAHGKIFSFIFSKSRNL